MILKVSSTFDWQEFRDDEANAEFVAVLDAMKFYVVMDMPNAIVHNSRKLILCQANANRGDIQSALNDVDWTIAGFEGQGIIQNRVLSHLLPLVEYDEDNEPVEVPITDCTGRLATLAGRDWTY